MVKAMTYEEAGVDYGELDPFKIAAQVAASLTDGNISRFGMFPVAKSRGESAFILEAADCYWAHVEEGLGTKNLVADAMLRLTGKSYYKSIAQDALAMIVNDMITLGALPVSAAMHLAVGDSNWFADKKRAIDLVEGWRIACDLSRCAWGGGETPTLKEVVSPRTAVLSGSAVGIIKPKSRYIKGNIQDGDAIVLVESSGIHANGLTLARRIADNLPDGYLTKISDGRAYGEALLDPAHIYVGLVEDCFTRGANIHYAANITGHGWRKLMRVSAPFEYVIKRLPSRLPIFDFMQENGPVSVREAYANFNMGAGFALYVPKGDVQIVCEAAATLGLRAFDAGDIRTGENKKVIIEPMNIEYLGDTLNLR